MEKEEKQQIVADLSKRLKGEVSMATTDIKEHSRDWSLFAVEPSLVVFPKDATDVKAAVSFVAKHKAKYPNLSLTGRAAGTDMTGGPLTESIVLSFTRFYNHFTIDEEARLATVEPGVYYRDFASKADPLSLSMPSYPASKDLAAWGGLIMNNSGGERTLRWGQTRQYIESVKMVLANGREYSFGRLSRAEFNAKKRGNGFLANIYRQIDDLLDKNRELIKAARPSVAKNSAGYALFDIYDEETDSYDLAQLFVGSQGTLGILTEAKVRLVKDKPYRLTIPIFFKSWDELPSVVQALLPHDLETLETFDDETMKLGLRFLPQIARLTGQNLLAFSLRFLPEVWLGLRMFGLPKLVILAEIAEDSPAEAEHKAAAVLAALKPLPVYTRAALREEQAEKYWLMRRNSFKILTENTKDKRSAPFVEDFCVRPDQLPSFLPEALAILKKYDIKANLAGHAGDGNFHIIPLMDLRQEAEREKILTVCDEFYKLVARYNGSITAEHNDGILRTPYLPLMYGDNMMSLFATVKNIFDPDNIFNPGKKVADINTARAYLKDHITPENK